MSEFIFHLFISSFLCIGIRVATDRGMILEKPANWITSKIPKYLHKPTFDCAPCMASIWGTLYYWINVAGPMPSFSVVNTWILFVFCLCGLNAVLAKYFA